MTKALLFWVIMLLWLVLGAWFYWPAYGPLGLGVGVPFVLFLLLGWQVFGRPIQ